MAYHRYHGSTRASSASSTRSGRACGGTTGGRSRTSSTRRSRGQPITVYGDGSQTRSFQYVSDLVDGIWRLMESDVHDPVNIGNPHEMTLLELAKRVIRLAGSASPIVFQPLPVDDPKIRQPDITRARTLLGLGAAASTWTRGLRQTIEWFRQALDR